MTLTRANSTAASAIRSLRVKALLNEVPKTEIAKEVGLSRQTAAKRLKSTDMRLSEFIAIAEMLGENPGQVIVDAANKEKASAAADAQSK